MQQAKFDQISRLSTHTFWVPLNGGTPDLLWESCWLLTEAQPFTVQNLDQLYVLVPPDTKLPIMI